MKLRSVVAGAIALVLSATLALAQGGQGTSPLSGAKGGTNNSFMQFIGPTSPIKTYTLPNASGTIAVYNAIGTWTGAQSFTDDTLILLGATSGSSTLKAPATGGGIATLFPGTDTIAGIAATQTLTNKTFNCANNTCTVRLGSDVTGTMLAANFGALTGDVTSPGASYVTTLANIPSGVPMAGSILSTNIAAPATPAVGKTSLYVDSTDKRFHDKNDAGTIGTTAVASTCTSSNWFRTMSSAGAFGCSQPSFADLTSSVACSQIPALTGDVTTSAGSCATTIASAAVTYAKIQNVAALRVLGNPTGTPAAPSEIQLGSTFSFSAGQIVTNAFTGDVTTSQNSFAASIAANAVTNAKMATMAANTVKANATGSSAAPTDVAAATARSSALLNIDQATSTGDANYTILAADRSVYHTALSAARTDTLPAANAVNAGQTVIIWDPRGVATASNTVIVQRAGTDTVNGSVSFSAVDAAYGMAECISDGASRWNCQKLAGGGGGGSGTVTQITCNGGATVITTSGTCASREILSANRIYYVATTGSDSNTGMASATTGTVTFTNGSSAVGWTSHGRSVGDTIVLTTTGTLPTNFATLTIYFVKTVTDANTIVLAATSGGTAISAGSAGSGTHTATLLSPFLTIQKAIDVAAALDTSIYAVSIYVSGGTFTATNTIKATVGSGSITITGMGASLTTVAASADSAFTGSGCGTYNINSMKVGGGTTTNGFFVTGASCTVSGSGIELAAVSGQHVRVSSAATVRLFAYTISGGAGIHVLAEYQGRFTAVSITVTLTGTPVFSSQFIKAQKGGIVDVEGVTWSGSATGTRYICDTNSVINTATGSATTLPGNVNGTASSGCQYTSLETPGGAFARLAAANDNSLRLQAA